MLQPFTWQIIPTVARAQLGGLNCCTRLVGLTGAASGIRNKNYTSDDDDDDGLLQGKARDHPLSERGTRPRE
jgi:hypothetical protein